MRFANKRIIHKWVLCHTNNSYLWIAACAHVDHSTRLWISIKRREDKSTNKSILFIWNATIL